jgi:DNA polymerase V
VPLRRPSADTQSLVGAALVGLRAIYRPGFDYIKAGVMLRDLQGNDFEQAELDLETEPAARGELMQSLDRLNDRFGRGTVTLGSAGTKGDGRAWSMKQMLLTPAYTTKWADMPVARA